MRRRHAVLIAVAAVALGFAGRDLGAQAIKAAFQITDGTNTAAVKAASTAAGATDPALVVAVSPNNTLTDAADGATGSALPSKATYVGARDSSANLAPIVQCDKTVQVTISTATTTALVAVSGTTSVYVCSFTVEIVGVATTAGTLQLETGTGTACAAAVVAVTPTFIGSTTAGAPTVITQGSNLGYLIKGAASSGLCALSTTTTPQKVFISYAQA